jgi:hypothetical protein
MAKWRCGSTYSSLRQYTEVEQLHAPAVLLPAKQPAARHWIETGCAPEYVYTFDRIKKYSACAGTGHDLSVSNPQSRHYTYWAVPETYYTSSAEIHINRNPAFLTQLVKELSGLLCAK